MIYFSANCEYIYFFIEATDFSSNKYATNKLSQTVTVPVAEDLAILKFEYSKGKKNNSNVPQHNPKPSLYV